MTTVTQTITALPTAPNPSTPATFNTLAYPFTVAVAAMGPELNTMATQVNTVSGEVNTNATTAASDAASALTSKNAAIAAANFVGAWSGLTGAKTAGIAVEHLGRIWILLNNLADVTTSQPSVSGDWAQFEGTYYEERASNVNLAALDAGKVIKYTSGTFSQTFTAAATLGEGWTVTVYNAGTGVITLDPNASELIDGATTSVLTTGKIALVYCTGTAFKTVVYAAPVGDHSVMVTTGNGHGSTNTKIRRFTTTQSTTGTAITYADSATLGATFTINETGFYNIYYLDNSSTTTIEHGVSRNSTQLTTNVSAITAADRLMMCGQADADGKLAVSRTVLLAAADVIRPHSNGVPNSTSVAYSVFAIRKVNI